MKVMFRSAEAETYRDLWLNLFRVIRTEPSGVSSG
jgi:hypothetical protein